MPELPEVEVIVRHLNSKLSGLMISGFRIVYPQVLKNTPVGKLSRIKGQKITGVCRRGKYILMETDGRMCLCFHLKMTGQFRICRPEEPWDKHTHFGLIFSNFLLELRFRDVRKFGFVSCVHAYDLSKSGVLDFLGPEPLDIGRDQFVGLFNGRRARMKGLLLDQSFLAGIGNIYADEILFRAQVHPALSASSLEEKHLVRVWKAMNHVLRDAIVHGGSSIRDFMNADGREGDFQRQHQVYGREGLPCPVCSHEIVRLRINGRSSYFCPACQKLPARFNKKASDD